MKTILSSSRSPAVRSRPFGRVLKPGALRFGAGSLSPKWSRLYRLNMSDGVPPEALIACSKNKILFQKIFKIFFFKYPDGKRWD